MREFCVNSCMVVSTARRVGGMAVLVSVATMIWGGSATAASGKSAATTVRLGLTGIVTPSAPNGTWTMAAHPGQTIGFLAGLIPGVDHLDLSEDVAVRVSMDSSGLPGGSHSKTLNSHSPYRLVMSKAGAYPVRWTFAFVLNHGHKSTVEATRNFDASIVVGGSNERNSPGLVSPGAVPSRTAAGAGAPSSPAAGATPITTPHQSAAVTGAPASAPTPTITLPPDTGASRHGNPGSIAALPLESSTDTYVFTALVGTVVIGVLWLLWIASIKPILGR
jgi:hypothetical protein